MKSTRILSLFLIAALFCTAFAGCAAQSPTGTAAPTQAPAGETSQTPAANPTEPPAGGEDNPSAAGGGYEEGTSATDDIVNTTAADKVILVASFGTSFNQSRHLTIGGIETAIGNAYPDYQVRRAFTSQIIIDKLAEREGLKIDNVTQAMDRLVLDGVKEVIVQPTTVMNGFEYDDLIEEVTAYADKFDSLKIGKWLLADDSDFDTVAELLVDVTKGYRAEDAAIVYMGHGTEHASGAIYTKLQETLANKGYNDYIIGTVEHSIELDEVRETLGGLDVKKVILRPLMIVAGDHANNDMAGDEEDSWKVVLTEDGYTVETVLEGLGQIKGIQDLFIRHIADAMQSPQLSATPAALAAGVPANRIKNGTYPIEVDSSTSMFKIVECLLTVEDESMSAVMTLSGQGFSHVYMGTGAEADSDTGAWIDAFDNGERHEFTVPVEALDKGFECSGRSAKKETWYDHIVVFESALIPGDAFVPVLIDVTMTGGSGRASVESPAILSYREGTDMARIVWSSPNYTYMIVDGEKYLPVNTDGNSAFEIPVTLDMDMTVIACTVAMSEPKEIEYVLRFDSASIGAC